MCYRTFKRLHGIWLLWNSLSFLGLRGNSLGEKQGPIASVFTFGECDPPFSNPSEDSQQELSTNYCKNILNDLPRTCHGMPHLPHHL